MPDVLYYGYLLSHFRATGIGPSTARYLLPQLPNILTDMAMIATIVAELLSPYRFCFTIVKQMTQST
jgi:hypothetical protein